MNNLLEPVNNGSNYPFRDKLLKARQGRSGFNWSHTRIFTLSNAGLLLPVCCLFLIFYYFILSRNYIF